MRLVSSLTRTVGLTAALAALTVGAQAQTIGCATGGAGGAIPATGTGGGGTFPGTFPASNAFTLNVGSVPGGATVVTEVSLHGLTHTWRDDVMFTLTDPSGNTVNLSCRGGGSGDFIGDYTIVSPSNTCAAVWPIATGNLTPGVYQQNYNTWVDGTNGVFNASIETLAAQTGVWTLTAYDWAGGDSGVLTSFDVCFGTAGGASAPAPTLASPADLEVVTVSPVSLSWNAIGCATSYDVEVDGSVALGVPASPFSSAVAPGTHTWRVRANVGAAVGPWSALRSFDFVPPPFSVCVGNGTGAGPVPATGTGGGGTYPTILPPTPYMNSYSVTVPSGSTQIVKVDLTFSTDHTWIGDCQMVLTDPTGGNHTLVSRVGSVAGSVGLNCDLAAVGTYSIYEVGAAWPTVCPASGDIPAGAYAQSFGDWVSGDQGIFNTPLSAIPVSSGMWTLTIYDWAGGDSGVLADWQVCFNGATGPATYCTAGTSTNGCVPAISATAQPSATLASGCVLNVANVEGNKSGLIFYGVNNTGFSPTPWSAGSSSFLCVKAPTQRMQTQSSGGTNGACDGSLTQDWNAYQTGNPTALGNPFSVGDKVYAQAWYRDPPASKTTNLSDALEMTMLP